MKVLYCSQCGKKLLTYDNSSFRRYKSLVKRCKKCDNPYIDPRCHEIAIEGMPDVFSIKSYIFLIIFGAFLLWRGLYVLNRSQLGVPDEINWLVPSVIIIGGIVSIIGGIINIISISTGLKQKKYDRLYEESLERLNDSEYVTTLKNLGINIPEKKENEQ